MSEELSTARTDELKGYGFKPGVVISYCGADFDTAALGASLLESTYSSPKTIPVRLTEPYTAQVAVDLVHAVYPTHMAAEVPSGVAVHYETPDWYIEGWIQERTQRVRLYAMLADSDDEVSEVLVQVISEAPEADDLIYHERIE